MPCLILTGHPCAGKTTLAQLIADRAKAKFGLSAVTIINESTACPDQSMNECYATSQGEKATRGALKAALDRAMMADSSSDGESSASSSTLVILDSLNYIKGFRYELYCLSKAAQQQHAVVWVLNSVEQAKEWNQQRRQKHEEEQKGEGATDGDNASNVKQVGFTDELWEELVLRYEPPDERNRWDKPLYRIDVQPQNSKRQQQASEALEKSVYNMHNLSSVLNNNSDPATPTETSNDTQTSQNAANTSSVSSAAAAKKKQPKARFKRAKKPSSKNASTSSPPSAVAPAAPTNDTPTDDAAPTTQNETANNKDQDSDTALSKPVEEQVDDMLLNFLQSTKRLQQGMSTQQHVAHANADLMHLADTLTQQICRAIQQPAKQDNDDSDKNTITISHGSQELLVKIDSRLFSSSLSSEGLQTWRRQYLQWISTHPPPSSAPAALAQMFCEYLQGQLRSSS